MVLTLAVQGTDQFFVQRLLAARSRADAAWGVFASGVVVFAQFTLFLLIGVMLWVFYQQTPLPVPVDRADKIVSVYVLHNLGPGLAGTHHRGHRRRRRCRRRSTRSPPPPSTTSTGPTSGRTPTTRTSSACRASPRSAGVSCSWRWRWRPQHMAQNVLDAGLTVLGLSSGAVLGAFLIGTLRPSVGGMAVFTGMVAGIATVLAVWWSTPIAWTWHALIGTTVTVGDRADGGAAGCRRPARRAGARVIAAAPPMPDPVALAARVPAVEAVVRAALAAGTATCAVVEIGDARRRPRPLRPRPVVERRRRRVGRRRDDLRSGVADQGRSATTLLAMRLEEAGRCAMTDRVGRWWPAWYRSRARRHDARRPARARLRSRRAPRPLRRPARRSGLRRRDLPHAARGAAPGRRGVQRSRVHPARRDSRARRRRRARRAGRADAGRAHRRAARLPPAGRVAAAHGVHRMGGVAAARADRRGERREHLGDGRRGRSRRPVRHGTRSRRRRTSRAARAPRHGGRRPGEPGHGPPVRHTPHRCAGHDAGAGMGHDEADVVVRALHEPGRDRPYRVHGHVVVDRRRARRLRRAAHQPRRDRGAPPTRCAPCGRVSTTPCSGPRHERETAPAGRRPRRRIRAAPSPCSARSSSRPDSSWPRSVRCCRRSRRARAPACPSWGV